MNTRSPSRLHASVAGLLLLLPMAAGRMASDAAAAEQIAPHSDASQQSPAATESATSDATKKPKSKNPAAAASSAATAPAEEPRSTSSTPPPVQSFSAKAVPVRDYPRVASSGECAPTYRNGTRGACIAEQPCRGYGIRNDQSQVLCMCYLTKGGCDQESRCDVHAHACVADTKEPNYTE